ncbi:MAG: BON domain-containing protein [Rhodoferax sp.]|uniref:BON domain-containing protein n=1 Tax=Rhodoferax sp. TaxID=50421 RepID=UPI001B425444|nr:BON domain-containing protein [Rhodoferax sp.]MBP9904844.1 BON domain-containing protein [Rhodoferax sp.]
MRLLFALIASLAMTAAFAQSGNSSDGNVNNNAFKTLDKNADGGLSKDEVAADKETAKRFTKFDANKDGKLQEAEYLKAGQDNDKRVLADSAITTKVKSKFLITKGIPSTAISVETYEGTVQLSGFVDSKEQLASAAKVAKSISGVKSVKNNLTVK